MTSPGATAEEAIRAVLSRDDEELAVRRILEAYGGELYAFLLGALKDETRADDVFALFAENLWRSIRGKLEIRTSPRAYCYAIARNAMFRYLELVVRRERHQVPLSRAGIDEAVARARTETRDFLRTENRMRMAMLRESLDEEERTLLTLRLDRKLSFHEIAEVLAAEGEDDLSVVSARLRKRYQLLKEKLRKLATKAGIAPK